MFKAARLEHHFHHLRPVYSVTTTYQRAFKRSFILTTRKMSDLSIELTAPNGKKFTLPTGIFIDNEFVKAKSGDKVTSINPTFVLPLPDACVHC